MCMDRPQRYHEVPEIIAEENCPDFWKRFFWCHMTTSDFYCISTAILLSYGASTTIFTDSKGMVHFLLKYQNGRFEYDLVYT